MCARGVKELKSVSTAKRGWKNHNRVLLLGGTVLCLAIWTFMARPRWTSWRRPPGLPGGVGRPYAVYHTTRIPWI